MRNTKLISSLSKLWLGEFAAAISFVCAFIIVKNTHNLNFGIVEFYVFAVLIFVLLQGSYFWFYLRKRYLKKEQNDELFRSLYKVFRIMNILLLGVASILNTLQIVSKPVGYIVFNYFIIAFTVIEYVNYFYIRLSYPIKEFIEKVRRNEFCCSKLYIELRR